MAENKLSMRERVAQEKWQFNERICDWIKEAHVTHLYATNNDGIRIHVADYRGTKDSISLPFLQMISHERSPYMNHVVEEYVQRNGIEMLVPLEDLTDIIFWHLAEFEEETIPLIEPTKEDISNLVLADTIQDLLFTRS